MLAPKHKIVILPHIDMVLFVRKTRKGKKIYHRKPTTSSMKRLNRTLNKVINELYGPRIELEIGAVKVEW